MQIYKDQIYSFKLVSGEEFIGLVAEVDVNTYQIENPLTVTMTPQGPDTFPTLIAGDYSKNMQLSRSSVMFVANVEDHIQSSYIKAIEEMKQDIAKRREEKKDASSV